MQIDKGNFNIYMGDCFFRIKYIEPADAIFFDVPFGIDIYKKLTDGSFGAYLDKIVLAIVPDFRRDVFLDYFGVPTSEEVTNCNVTVFNPMQRAKLVFEQDFPPTIESFNIHSMIIRGDGDTLKTSGCLTLVDACSVMLAVSKAKSVVDPFMGFASMGQACVRRGVKYIGIEKEAYRFYSSYTKLKAIHSA